MPRRAAILVLISLLLGAVTTIAIAWTIAATRSNGSGSISIPNWHFASRQGVIYWCASSDSGGHSVFAIESQDPVQYQQWRENAQTPQGALPAFEPAPWVTIPVSDPGYLYVSNAFGWPTLALRGLVVEGLPTRTRSINVFTDYWLFGHPDDPRTIALPLGIIWPGFLINTLTYAAAWFIALFLGERTLRALAIRMRFRRAIRRGSCPTCCYDLRGDFSSGCPECGWNRAAALPTKHAAPHSGHTPDTLPDRS